MGLFFSKLKTPVCEYRFTQVVKKVYVIITDFVIITYTFFTICVKRSEMTMCMV